MWSRAISTATRTMWYQRPIRATLSCELRAFLGLAAWARLSFLLCAGCGARSELIPDPEKTLHAIADAGLSSADADAGPSADADAALDATQGMDARQPMDAPLMCSGTCSVGQTECQSGAVSTCVSDAMGCGAWAPPIACEGGSTCVDKEAGASCVVVDILPPRPIAPLSTSRVTSHRPMFHWALAGNDDGATVDVCADRACANLVTAFSCTGTSGAPTQDLAPGVYFWRIHGNEGLLTGPTTSAVWELTVPVRDTPVNTSWGTTLDVNGDGFADVAVGGTALLAGAAQLYFGSAAGLSTAPAFVLNGIPGVIGTPVASAGDVNGDGFGDLIVAGPGAGGNTGQFWIYFGNAAGSMMSAAILKAPNGTYEYGNEPASAGDVNGDGYGDVMVSAVSDEDNASLYIYFGSPDGPLGSPMVLPAGVGDVSSMASDINGDGFSDVVLAVNGGYFSGNSGAVDVYYGTATGLSATPVVLNYTGTTSTGFYLGVEAAGDVNGDGYGDIFVSLPVVGNGTVDVYLGSHAGLSTPPITIPNPAATGLYFGGPVSAGDIDGDGFDDAVFGAQGTSGVPTGAAYVFRGGALGLPTTPTATLVSPAGALGDFGEPVAGAGDINGDGFDDVLVGAPAYEAVGTIYVYSGGPNGLAGTPASFATMFEDVE